MSLRAIKSLENEISCVATHVGPFNSEEKTLPQASGIHRYNVLNVSVTCVHEQSFDRKCASKHCSPRTVDNTRIFDKSVIFVFRFFSVWKWIFVYIPYDDFSHLRRFQKKQICFSTIFYINFILNVVCEWWRMG